MTFVQRFGSSINLNPHFHVFFLDGVYVPAADGEAPVFVAAPPLADEDVQEIVETAAQRIVRLLQRRGLLDDSLVDEPRRQEPTEWRSGALELQCGASRKVYSGNIALFSGEFGVHIHRRRDLAGITDVPSRPGSRLDHCRGLNRNGYRREYRRWSKWR